MSKESLIEYIKDTWGTDTEILTCEVAEENSSVGVAYFKTLLRHFVVVFKLSTDGWVAVADNSPGIYPVSKGNVISIALNHFGEYLMMAVAGTTEDSLVYLLRILDDSTKLVGCFISPNKPDPSFGKRVRFDRNSTTLQIGEKVVISSDWGECQYLYLVDDKGVFHNPLIAMSSINQPGISEDYELASWRILKNNSKNALLKRRDELHSKHEGLTVKIGLLHDQISRLASEKLETSRELIQVGKLLQQYKET